MRRHQDLRTFFAAALKAAREHILAGQARTGFLQDFLREFRRVLVLPQFYVFYDNSNLETLMDEDF